MNEQQKIDYWFQVLQDAEKLRDRALKELGMLVVEEIVE